MSDFTCSFCGRPCEIGSTRCRHCGGGFEADMEETIVVDDAATSIPLPSKPEGASDWSNPLPAGHESSELVAPGALIAGRYEVVELLGRGGMGAVFRAWDRELERPAAIKIIRPELAEDAATLHRFKQELILARQVTHKNVIRIYDLGQSNGMKFITMEYVEGQNLRQILNSRRKLPPDEAAAIASQVCLALEAAHGEGVIHRDLKPQNIMIDPKGRVLVMDFGIARSLQVPGRTQTGALLGTPEYMSPEQAKGEKLDPRSDLFSLGIIFYELLLGTSPYKADTAIGTLLRRIRERPPPPAELDASVPRPLSRIVTRCLAVDPDERYQSASAVHADIEHWRNSETGAAAGGTSFVARTGFPRGAASWIAAAAGVFLLGLAGIYLLLEGRFSPAPQTDAKPVTILVADFENSTSDAVFDGTLESALSLALEGAPFVSVYARGDARKVSARLQRGSTQLNENVARLVAVREGIRVLISGSISAGSGYRVSVRAVDAVSGNVIIGREARAGNRDGVLRAIGSLAIPLRRALGDTTPESAQLNALGTFDAGNIDAAHEYARARDFQSAGKASEAIRAYRKAIDLDPNMARAWAGLASVNGEMGRNQDSAQFYERAMALADRMTDREKYGTIGGYYLSVRNTDKAIEALSELVRLYPADAAGISHLAYAYSMKRNLAKALATGRRAMDIYPKSLIERFNVARYAMYAGKFEEAIGEARSVLEADPSVGKAHVVVALSLLASGQADLAAQEYQNLRSVDTLGAGVAATGLADLSLFEGRAAHAISELESLDNSGGYEGDAEGSARRLLILASARLLTGQAAQATATAERARNLGGSETFLFELGRFYVESGQDAKARAVSADLAGRMFPEPQAYGRILAGELLLKGGEPREAARLFLESNKLVDTWYGRFALGKAYLELGSFTEAHTELENALKRKGEATAVYLDEVPSYRLFPPLLLFLERSHEGLKSGEAPVSLKSFMAIRNKGLADSMVHDARWRLDVQ